MQRHVANYKWRVGVGGPGQLSCSFPSSTPPDVDSIWHLSPSVPGAKYLCPLVSRGSDHEVRENKRRGPDASQRHRMDHRLRIPTISFRDGTSVTDGSQVALFRLDDGSVHASATSTRSPVLR